MEDKSRRSFLKKSAIAVAGTGLCAGIPHSLYGTTGPKDRLNIGVIGLGFGMVNMRQMMDGDKGARCVALCDVDKARLETKAAELKKDYPEQAGKVKLYSDFRKLLADKSIDGVIIATPDHWHTYIYAEASKAGKAIYIEKPTGYSVADCNLMTELQGKHQNVVTTGLWHISLDYFKDAFDILRTGALGDVYKVHAWITGNTDPVVYGKGRQAVPETLNYDMWLGPAPKRPYVKERVSNWRRYWDYGGGGQTDWIHYLDSAFDGIAALGHERTYPKSVYSVGYKNPETMTETPAVQTSVFQFDDYHVVWEHQVSNLYNRSDGVAWIGSKGTLVCNRMGYEIIPQTADGKPLMEAKKVEGPYGNQFNHMVNWGKCIRENNQKTNSPIDKGSYASLLANVANISYRTGGKSLQYLPDEQKFLNNPEADALIAPEYQNNWDYPRYKP